MWDTINIINHVVMEMA